MRSRKKTRVLIVDDHPLIRKGLSDLLAIGGFSVCGEAKDSANAMELLSLKKPDIAIIDLKLGNENGMRLIRMVRTTLPSIKILVLSMHDEELFAESASRAGADGYIMKETMCDEIINALKRITIGGTWYSAAVTAKLAGTKKAMHAAGNGALSVRELEVFEATGKGLSTPEIARSLGISVKTVETFKSRIKLKLRMDDKNELLRRAIRYTAANTI